MEEDSLTVGELASHDHGPGSFEITGEIVGGIGSGYLSGAFTSSSSWTNKIHIDSTGNVSAGPIKFNASKTFSGKTGTTGSSTAHNNLPPAKASYCWLRTA